MKTLLEVRAAKRLAVLFMLTAIGLCAAPQMGGRIARAQEGTDPPTAEPDVVRLQGLSRAFRHVAKQLKPSVVSIQSTRIIRTRGASPFRHPFFNDPMRDFFGDDQLRRFFEREREGRSYRQQGIGSGVIIDAKGHILTNNHVVADRQGNLANEINVKLADGREFKIKVTSENVHTDPKSDLAVIKINADKLVPAKLGNSDGLQVGDWVVAIGNPFGLDLTVTAGICSAKGRALRLAEYEDFIQTDAAINPGNSGGPLVNLRGEVVGINTAIVSRSGGYQGLGFAIPSNMARTIMQSLVTQGKVTRGFLGVTIQNVDAKWAKYLGMEKPAGALVEEIVPGSPAAKAGLKEMDVILKVGGKPVGSVKELRRRIADTPVGKKVKLELLRNRKTVTVDVTVTELPSRQTAAAAGKNPYGFEVTDLTAELAQRYGYRERSGVMISSINPEGIAAEVGLRPGWVILSVDREAVNSAAAFNKAMAKVNHTRGIVLRLRLPNGRTPLVILRK